MASLPAATDLNEVVVSFFLSLGIMVLEVVVVLWSFVFFLVEILTDPFILVAGSCPYRFLRKET